MRYFANRTVSPEPVQMEHVYPGHYPQLATHPLDLVRKPHIELNVVFIEAAYFLPCGHTEAHHERRKVYVCPDDLTVIHFMANHGYGYVFAHIAGFVHLSVVKLVVVR